MQTVLMIDDSKTMHSVVKARLADEELAFHSALSGTQGVQMARDVKPDVILLDVEMAAPDGFEVCRMLKADAATSSIPVIFLSATTSTGDKVRGLNLGAVDYVTKPFEAPELLARVRASLRTKELMDMLEQRAMIDGLTGLRNRAYFNQRITAELAAARRSGRPLACIMADVDHFKSVNDTHGHGFGDLVLRGVAQSFHDHVRAEDVVCRYGGEEIVVLTPGVDAAGAAVLAERIRTNIAARKFVRGGVSLQATSSFGVSDSTIGVDELVERADRELYRAKHSGRNRVAAESRIGEKAEPERSAIAA